MGFDFSIEIPSQKSETMNHLKTLTWLWWKPKLGQETHVWTSFQKNFTWMDSEKGNSAPPPPWFLEHKKPAWDKVKKKVWELVPAFQQRPRRVKLKEKFAP